MYSKKLNEEKMRFQISRVKKSVGQKEDKHR